MFDVEQRRRISVEELRDHLVGGGNFEAETEETGRDCTLEVLRSVMGAGSSDATAGAGALGLPGLPGVGALGASVELLGLARMVGDRIDGFDRDDDRTATRRARRRGRSGDWAGASELPAADEGSA